MTADAEERQIERMRDAYRDVEAFSPEERDCLLWKRLQAHIDIEISRRVASLIADNATGERDRGAIEALQSIKGVPDARYWAARDEIDNYEGN